MHQFEFPRPLRTSDRSSVSRVTTDRPSLVVAVTTADRNIVVTPTMGNLHREIEGAGGCIRRCLYHLVYFLGRRKVMY